MRRDAGKIVELPGIRLCAHPNVECAIHPGKSIAGVAVCAHVLEGAPVFLKEEPDLDRWGSVLCELCAFSETPFVGARIACEKCVRYHFSSREEIMGVRDGQANLSDQELMAMAETEGLRSYRSVRDGKSPRARNPFESSFMRWAWNLGFRLGRHLDEARRQISSPDVYSQAPQ